MSHALIQPIGAARQHRPRKEHACPIYDGQSDYCDAAGALELKQRIESYWRERGHSVVVTVERHEFHPTMRTARFDLRSNMVNGAPVREAR